METMTMNEHTANGQRADGVAAAICRTLESPNELDRNLEPANVVDGFFEIARSIGALAGATEGLANAIGGLNSAVDDLAREVYWHGVITGSPPALAARLTRESFERMDPGSPPCGRTCR